MTPDDLTTRVLDALVRVAPEIDRTSVRPDVVLRDEYDLDSMDFLNFVIGLHDAFGVDIPESDYPALATLAGCVRYLQAHGVAPVEGGSAPPRRQHRFEGALSWERGGETGTAMNHTVVFAGRPPLVLSAPVEYHGDATRLSPEELFVASVASCQLLTYLALMGRAGIAIARYEDHPVGILAMADRQMRMTEVQLRPRITLAPGADATKARTLVDAAHDACFVANSVTARVCIEPQIVSA
jgi:organic hydroperoxide reductase OsmC/OhrA/acyl carrier protein